MLCDERRRNDNIIHGDSVIDRNGSLLTPLIIALRRQLLSINCSAAPVLQCAHSATVASDIDGRGAPARGLADASVKTARHQVRPRAAVIKNLGMMHARHTALVTDRQRYMYHLNKAAFTTTSVLRVLACFRCSIHNGLSHAEPFSACVWSRVFTCSLVRVPFKTGEPRLDTAACVKYGCKTLSNKHRMKTAFVLFLRSAMRSTDFVTSCAWTMPLDAPSH